MAAIRRLCAAVTAATIILGIAVAQETREVRKTVPLTKDGKVTIETYKGSVKVEAWDKAEVDIEAKIEADEWGRDDEQIVRDTEIDIDATASSVRIKTDYSNIERRHSSFWDLFNGDSGNLPFVHYVIRMPRTASLRLKDHKSESTINGLRSDLDVNTYKGSVEITGLDGGLALETYKGNCRVAFDNMRSSSRCETYKGDLEVQLPSQAGFELDANVGRRGDFDSDFEVSSSGATRRHRDNVFSGQVNGGGPTLRMRTDKGNLKLVKR